MSRVALLLAAASAVILLPAEALAYKRATVQGVSGRYLYWYSRKITYVINNQGCKDVPFKDVVGAVKRSFFTWAGSSCTDIYFLYGGAVASTRTNLTMGQEEKPDDQNMIVWHEKWPPTGSSNGLLTKDVPAVTTVMYEQRNGVIFDADIDLNGQYFYWTTTNDKTKISTDIQNTVTHEIGHLLGLAHSGVKDGTMYEQTYQGETQKRDLHPDDVKGLCAVYPYGKTTPRGPNQGEVEDDVQGGCGVARGPGAWSPLVLVVLVLLARRRRSATPSRGRSWDRGSPRPPRC